jgi:hypothetical protein
MIAGKRTNYLESGQHIDKYQYQAIILKLINI